MAGGGRRWGVVNLSADVRADVAGRASAQATSFGSLKKSGAYSGSGAELSVAHSFPIVGAPFGGGTDSGFLSVLAQIYGRGRTHLWLS